MSGEEGLDEGVTFVYATDDDFLRNTLRRWGFGHLEQKFISEEIDLATFLNPNFEKCIPRLVQPMKKEVEFFSKWEQFRKHVELTDLSISRDEPVDQGQDNGTSQITTNPDDNSHSNQSSLSNSLSGLTEDLHNLSPVSPRTTSPAAKSPLIPSPVLDACGEQQAGTSGALKRKTAEESRVPPKIVKASVKIIDKIRATLQFTGRGKHILSFEGKHLPVKQQNVIAELIIDHLLAENEDGGRIPHCLIKEYAESIVQLFPYEDIDTYYIPYCVDKSTDTKVPARGKLISQYRNIPKNIKASGLSKDGKQAQNQTTEEAHNPPEAGEQEEAVEKALKFLIHRIEPWDDVVDAWKKTSKFRIKKLQSAVTQHPVGEYLNTYRALREPKGYLLVEIDFETGLASFAGKKLALFDAWPAFRDKA